MKERDYGERKFIATLAASFLGTGALFFGALVEVPEGYWVSLPAFFILQGAVVASYNWANLRQAQNGSAPR